MSLTFVSSRGIPHSDDPFSQAPLGAEGRLEDLPLARERAAGKLTMRHTLSAEGFGVRLRPVQMDDAAFIVWLRNLDHVRGRVGDSATDTAGQEAWLEAYFRRQGDYYFIIETLAGNALGAYGIYDIKGDSAESGRWIIRSEVPAALPSAVLAFELAFDKLRLRELRVRTISTNTNVLSLNRKLGFTQTRVEPGAQIIGGKPVDMIHFLLTAKDWARIREKFIPLARLAEKQLAEWQEAQLAAN